MSDCAYGELYRRIRAEVLQRFSGRCVVCGESAAEVHHRDTGAYPCGEFGQCCGRTKLSDADIVPMCIGCHEVITKHRQRVATYAECKGDMRLWDTGLAAWESPHDQKESL